MTERELKNKIKALKKELELMMLYEQDFIEKVGRLGLDAEINKRLEQYRYYLTKLNKLDNEK